MNVKDVAEEEDQGEEMKEEGVTEEESQGEEAKQKDAAEEEDQGVLKEEGEEVWGNCRLAADAGVSGCLGVVFRVSVAIGW